MEIKLELGEEGQGRGGEGKLQLQINYRQPQQTTPSTTSPQQIILRI